MDLHLLSLTPLRGGLRRHLLVLVLVPLIPMLLWAGGLTVWSSLQERQALQRGLTETARALSIAVDQEIRLTTEALQTAALSRSLVARDIEQFALSARRLAGVHNEWAALLLIDSGGDIVFNSATTVGGADPSRIADVQSSIAQVLDGGGSMVSDGFRMPVLDEDAVLVAVPVHDQIGRVSYVVAAAIRANRLTELLEQQGFQRDWFAVVLDTRGRALAGVPADEVVLDADGAGHNVLAAEERSNLTGWTVRSGTSTSRFRADLLESLGTTFGFGLLVLAASIALARVIAGRILRPVQALTAVAQPFLGDHAAADGVFGISELDALNRALDVLSGELAKTQQHFLSFFEAAPVMLFVLDPSNRLIAANQAWATTLGYGRDEVLGRSLNDFSPGGDADVLPCSEDLCHSGRDRMPARLVTKAGDVREVLVSCRPDRDEDGRLLRIIGAVLDVTEQHRAEEGLARAVEAAERANDAKTRFLAAASHDLRQPLQALSLYLGVLKARLQGREEQVMEAVGQCVESLTGLLNDMLDVARLDAGVISPKLSDVPASRLLERVVAAWRIQAEAKGLDLRVVPCSAVVHTDPALMDRVLSNLVANAVRYTEGGRILVGGRRLPDGRLRLEVWDTGIGIPADKLGEIFEEFRQLGNPERRRDKGTGLGLAIVRRIADLLGHELQVRSRAGCGSVFSITLPTAAACSVESAAGEAVPDHARRILVVDDEVLVRSALELVLGEMGHQVDSADSVEEAVRRSRVHRPELVIADFRLAGGTTGIDVIRAVRASCGRDLPAVVLTGDTDPATIRRIVGEGLHLLHKPLQLDALRGFLKQVA